MEKVNPIQLQKYLKGLDYPVNKKELISAAKKNGADKAVNSLLNMLPERDYQTPVDVSKELGKIE